MDGVWLRTGRAPLRNLFFHPPALPSPFPSPIHAARLPCSRIMARARTGPMPLIEFV
jgi:hypothetical protein